MNISRKGFAPVVVLLVVAAVILGGVFYWRSQVFREPSVSIPAPTSVMPTPATQPSSTVDASTSLSISTANWKTYRNEKYGFEVRYPSEPEILNDSLENDLLRSITIGDDFSISITSREDALQQDIEHRKVSVDCINNPEKYAYGYPEGCGDPNSSSTISEWDSNHTLLGFAVVGDQCNLKWNYTRSYICRVVLFNGNKAIENYSGGCFEGCSTWKTYIFYNRFFRYEVILRLVDGEAVSMDQVRKIEHDNFQLRILNEVAQTLRLL